MAGLIPRAFIDELINRLDIVEVIDSRVPLKKKGREYQACCPFHNEKTPSFTVSPDKQFYHCFGCGMNGTALSFVMEHERLSFPEAVEELAASLGMEVPREDGAPAKPRTDPTLYDALSHAGKYFQQQLRSHEPAKAYLKNRGVSGEIARDYGIGYAPDGWQTLIDALQSFPSKQLEECGLAKHGDRGNAYGLFRDRVMFPIRDRRGRVIGFGGRVMGDGEPKYLNSPETPVFHKGQELYGLHEARQASRDLQRLLVVEGYMDVVALAQAGVKYAVATLGTATTPEHLKLLFRFTEEVVFCFDGDRAGRAAGWKALATALPELTGRRQVKLLFLPAGEDPDSLVRAEGKEAFEERIHSAKALADVLLEDLVSQVDLRSIDGAARLIELARPWMEKVANPTLRELLLQALSQRCNLPVEKFSQQLKAKPQARSAARTQTKTQAKTQPRTQPRTQQRPQASAQPRPQPAQPPQNRQNAEGVADAPPSHQDGPHEYDGPELSPDFDPGFGASEGDYNAGYEDAGSQFGNGFNSGPKKQWNGDAASGGAGNSGYNKGGYKKKSKGTWKNGKWVATPEIEPGAGQAGAGTQRTPLRRLVGLCLQHPQLARAVGPEQLAELDTLAVPGAQLLHELLSGLQQRPASTTGAVLEQWRGHPHLPHLQKLAVMNSAMGQQLKVDTDLASGEAAAGEFLEQWKLLMERGRSARIEQLLALSRTGDLSAEQRQELTALLRQR